MYKLDETEKALKGAQDANLSPQVLGGLRQDVRTSLRAVQDMNATYLAPRAVTRVMGTLLKSISDDARTNLAKARKDGRTSVLNKAIAQAAGTMVESDFYAGILNGTPGADVSLLNTRFKKDEALGTKEVLDQAYARERAQFSLAKARIGFGKTRDEKMRKAYETALSAGVDEKVLAPTKQHLKAIDTRVEAIEEIQNASKRKGITALEEALEKGVATGVNPLLLKMGNSRLTWLKKDEKRQEERSMTLEMKKQREDEILELRRRQAESDMKVQGKNNAEGVRAEEGGRRPEPREFWEDVA